jgi:hypothetical protein
MTSRWFQIHLSTAVVLMLCAGGLLWLNVEKWPNDDLETTFAGLDLRNETGVAYVRGWPWAWEEKTFPDFGWGTLNYWSMLALNIAVAIGVLGIVAAFCELLLRRYRRV